MAITASPAPGATLSLVLTPSVSGTKKVEQIKETGAEYVAAACSNCKRQLTQLMEYHKMDVAVGGVHDMLSRAIMIDGKAADRQPLE